MFAGQSNTFSGRCLMQAQSPRVTIVIPNWNGLTHLPECLGALTAQSFVDHEVVVVDNASSDGSVEWVRSHYPDVRILELAHNAGFSGAVNAGMLDARTEYVALLNNDTSAEMGWLQALVAALDTHRAYDVAASQMVLYDSPELLNAAGDVYLLGRMAGKNRGYGRPAARYGTMERVLGACAGAALYRRSVFDEVGLFDEDFFLLSEDTDFNLRCLIAGKRCLYVPKARVRHKVRATIDTEPFAKTACLAARNEAIVAGKCLPTIILLLIPILWPYRLIRQTLPVRPSKWRLWPTLIRLVPTRVLAEARGFRLGLAKRPAAWRLQAVGTLQIIRWLVKGYGPA